jgi:hypothetical protein
MPVSSRDVKSLPTYEQVNEVLECRPDVGLFYWRISHGKVTAGKRAGALSHKGYVVIHLFNVLIAAHRLMWLFMMKEWPPSNMAVHHKNHNRSDNRWENLELRSTAGNNSEKTKTGITGIMKASTKSSRYIISRSFGNYKTIEDAKEINDLITDFVNDVLLNHPKFSHTSKLEAVAASLNGARHAADRKLSKPRRYAGLVEHQCA